MTKTNRRVHRNQGQSLSSRLLACWRYCHLGIWVCTGIGAVGITGFYSVQLMQTMLARPVTTVVVNAHFQYLDKDQVVQMISPTIGSSFIVDDINRIKQQVASMPWVDTVSLQRQWPDTLLVNVSEQIPVARWGNKGFINVRGELIKMNDLSSLMHLASLQGQDIPALIQQYAVLANTLRPYDMSVTFLQKDRRGVWQLRLDNGWHIMLGQGDVLEKIQRLTGLLEGQWLYSTSAVAAIDMRYENGLAVRWASPQNEKNESATDDGQWHMHPIRQMANRNKVNGTAVISRYAQSVMAKKG